MPQHRYPGRRPHLRPPNFDPGPPAFLRNQQLGDIQIRISEPSEDGRCRITMSDQKGAAATITATCPRESLPQLADRIRAMYLETRSAPQGQIRIMTMMLIMSVLKFDPAPKASLTVPIGANDDGRWALRLDGMKIEVRKGSDLVGLVRSAVSKRAAQAVTPTAPFPAISAHAPLASPPPQPQTPAHTPASPSQPAPASPLLVRRRPIGTSTRAAIA